MPYHHFVHTSIPLYAKQLVRCDKSQSNPERTPRHSYTQLKSFLWSTIRLHICSQINPMASIRRIILMLRKTRNNAFCVCNPGLSNLLNFGINKVSITNHDRLNPRPVEIGTRNFISGIYLYFPPSKPSSNWAMSTARRNSPSVIDQRPRCNCRWTRDAIAVSSIARQGAAFLRLSPRSENHRFRGLLEDEAMNRPALETHFGNFNLVNSSRRIKLI